MKNRFLKKIIITIPAVIIIMILLNKAMIFLGGSRYQNNIFLFKLIHETVGIGIIVFLIQRENFLNWFSVFRNNLVSSILVSALIYFSLTHTFQVIHDSKSVVSLFTHITYLLLCLSVGFFEELFFRILVFGYVIYLFKNSNSNSKTILYKEIIITSLLFATVHLTNIFNYDYVSVINQIMISFLLGIVLQCLFIRFNNIILNAIVHGMINYNGAAAEELLKIKDVASDTSSGNSIFQTLTTVFIFSVILIPICFFLIKKKKYTIMESENNNQFIFKKIV